MLATSIADPFDDPEWLFEIKFDGYRAVAFINKGKVRLVSRNQNDLTAQYSELHSLPDFIKAETAILDGEIAAFDDQGRSSFSLMQQRTGIRDGRRRVAARSDVPVLYYVFDLLYVDGYDLHRVPLVRRKAALAKSRMPPAARFGILIISRRARRSSRPPGNKGWRGSWLNAGIVTMRNAAPRTGSRSRLPKPWIALSADTPTLRAAGIILDQLCLGCMTRRGS